MQNNRKEQINLYIYDDYGNVAFVSNSNHIVNNYAYDNNNNLIEIDDAYGNSVSKKKRI